MITFDDLQAGQSFGEAAVLFDEALVAKWVQLFPADADTGLEMPDGMTAVLTIKAYADLVAPRPPGNIHGNQKFKMLKRPCLGETIHTEFLCSAKERRKERNWVSFQTRSRNAAGDLLFTGEMRVLWAR